MSRNVTVFLPVRQEHVSAIELVLQATPSEWLPDARPDERGGWITTVKLGPLHRDVVAQVGPVRNEGGSLWRDLSWEPIAQVGDRLPVHETLPTFQGEIGLHRERAVLVIDGTYDVPGGRLGEFADAVALGGAARSTMSRLLADIIADATADIVPTAPAG